MTKTVIIDNSSLYIEEYKTIEFFNENKIHILLKNKKILITGNKLIIESYNKYNLKISGEIHSVEYEYIISKNI